MNPSIPRRVGLRSFAKIEGEVESLLLRMDFEK
jgi:hypothetical protein